VLSVSRSAEVQTSLSKACAHAPAVISFLQYRRLAHFMQRKQESRPAHVGGPLRVALLAGVRAGV
jgi:hypothetical protein